MKYYGYCLILIIYMNRIVYYYYYYYEIYSVLRIVFRLFPGFLPGRSPRRLSPLGKKYIFMPQAKITPHHLFSILRTMLPTTLQKKYFIYPPLKQHLVSALPRLLLSQRCRTQCECVPLLNQPETRTSKKQGGSSSSNQQLAQAYVRYAAHSTHPVFSLFELC